MTTATAQRDQAQAIREHIRGFLSRGWWAPTDIEKELKGRGVLTTAYMSKLRDLRKTEFGGETIAKRPKPGRPKGSQVMQYHLVRPLAEGMPLTEGGASSVARSPGPPPSGRHAACSDAPPSVRGDPDHPLAPSADPSFPPVEIPCTRYSRCRYYRGVVGRGKDGAPGVDCRKIAETPGSRARQLFPMRAAEGRLCCVDKPGSDDEAWLDEVPAATCG